jgi:hypothetical protein
MPKKDTRKTTGAMGRPTLYKKPHRTTIMQSDEVKHVLLPQLVEWIGCSANDIREAALRAYYRREKELRGK